MLFIWDNTSFNAGNDLRNTVLVSKTWLKSNTDQRLSDICMQEWCAEVNSHAQCKVYRIFKTTLTFENYLINFPLRNRLNFCRIRCSNSKIPVVTGRYDSIVFHERFCTLCNEEKIGDEFYYFFECLSFSQSRKKYIAPYFYRNPNTLKMQNLFQSKSKKTPLNISLFCGEILSRF